MVKGEEEEEELVTANVAEEGQFPSLPSRACLNLIQLAGQFIWYKITWRDAVVNK